VEEMFRAITELVLRNKKDQRDKLDNSMEGGVKLHTKGGRPQGKASKKGGACSCK